MKRGQRWFQNLLQCMIVAAGSYILYRGGWILAESGWPDRLFRGEEAALAMKEMAASVYLPDYEAVSDGWEESWAAGWLKELLPVLWEQYDQMREQTEKKEDRQWEEIETERETENRETDPETKKKETEAPETEAGTETETKTETETETQEAAAVLLDNLADYDYLMNHFFSVDPDTTADPARIDGTAFLTEDLTIEKNPGVPQILIYHTHSQETFLDSEEGNVNDSIVGIGNYLTELLEEKYGYQVIHDTGVYDLIDGVLDRSAAYDYARESIQKILDENPTVEVVIDLHRDGVDGIHFVTDVNGKDTAQIMFLNGMSMDSQGQPVSYLPNPYIQENLAFSFQLQLAASRNYPGFTRNIYLKGQRYNLHLRPRSLLIEAGSQLNTVEEEMNAMEPLADILNQVLTGEPSGTEGSG